MTEDFITARSECLDPELKKHLLIQYNKSLFLYILKSPYYKNLQKYLKTNKDLLKKLRKRYYRNRTYNYWFYNTPRRFIKKTKKKSLHFFVDQLNNRTLIKVYDEKKLYEKKVEYRKRGIISLNNDPKLIDDIGDSVVDREKEAEEINWRMAKEDSKTRKEASIRIQRFYKANLLRDKMNLHNSVFVLAKHACKITEDAVLQDQKHFLKCLKKNHKDFKDRVKEYTKENSAKKIQNAYRDSNTYSHFKKYLNKYAGNLKKEDRVFKVLRQKPLTIIKKSKIHPVKPIIQLQSNIRTLLGRCKYLNLLNEEEENEKKINEKESEIKKKLDYHYHEKENDYKKKLEEKENDYKKQFDEKLSKLHDKLDKEGRDGKELKELREKYAQSDAEREAANVIHDYFRDFLGRFLNEKELQNLRNKNKDMDQNQIKYKVYIILIYVRI